jgi:TAK1-binding protein 2
MATHSPKQLSDQKSPSTPAPIGAAVPTKTSPPTTSTTPTDHPSTAPAKTQAQCHCSNISIMQLFHEMKQEFPTVPDNITLDLVYANCHNRLGCIEGMRKAALAFPCSAQAYPSQSIQAAKTTPTSPPVQSLPPAAAALTAGKPPAPPKRINSRQGGESVVKSDENQKIDSPSDNNGDGWSRFNHDRVRNPFVPIQRPTTLSVKKDVYQPTSPNRPIRQAPPPPTVDPQQPPEGLNVSLNVMVSPVASRRPPSRHTTALQVQPEPPYLVDQDAQSPRSYTSVNFTLRQPTTSPQSPIDISAGPSLTYSSSSFDARQGYQSRLQITVGGAATSANGGAAMVGGGSISAMRARPRSCYNIQEEVEHEQHVHRKQVLTGGVSLDNVADTGHHLSKSAGELKTVR